MVAEQDFANVVSFVTGYDEAHSRMQLTGFREWLVTQAGCLDRRVWWSLVAHLTEPVGQKPIRHMDPEMDARTVNTLFDLLDEFLELRQEHDGLRRIYAAYEQWSRHRNQHSCVAGCSSTCPSVTSPRPKSRTPTTGTSKPTY